METKELKSNTMTPISFTVKNGVTHFHYKFSELKNFVKLGKKHGNVGVIVTKRDGKMLTYRGFGTIESPINYIITFCINESAFFGTNITDEERLIPPKPYFTKENTRLITIDLSTIKKKQPNHTITTLGYKALL